MFYGILTIICDYRVHFGMLFMTPVSKDVTTLSKIALADACKSILAEGFDFRNIHPWFCTVLME